jgi:undecaprenyl-phosphate 4-deoxy-4-formamido-L-arabinose transferase
MQLTLLGILGEYVGRIYLGVSDKPQSVVRNVVRSSDATSHSQ